jgi:hypothetical protein
MTKSRDLANAATALNAVSATELGYVDGVTSAIQTQIDTKLASSTAATTYQAINTNVSTTELGYLDGVTSAIQTQLNQKPEVVAGKNAVLNSNFSVWQRGTSITTASAVYTADRWQSGIASAGTVSRQVTGDTTNLPNIQYCLRNQRTAASSSTSDLALSQSFETINSIPFVGKTIAFSFYARKGSNFSATSDLLTARVVTGTGTDQNLYSGYTGQATALQVSATLTTTWQRFSGTVAIASTVTELGVQFFATPTGTAGAADYYDITGVQLEVGSVATPYAPNGATYQAELAACQRYYYRAGGNAAYENFGFGTADGTTAGNFLVFLKSTLRTNAASVDFASLEVNDPGTGAIAVTGLTIDQTGANQVNVRATVASGMTSKRPYFLRAAGTTAGYLGFSAEL